MKKNKDLILAGISILIGGMCMRLAWLFINHPLGPVIVIAGAVLFLGGVIYFVITIYNRKHKF